MLPPSTPVVLVLDETPESYLDGLRARFPALRIEACRDGEQAQSHVARLQAQIILSCKSDRIPGADKRDAIMQPSVKWVHVCGAGFDHIDPISDFAAIVTNSAGVLSAYLGETIIGMMMAMSFGFPAYFHHQRAHRWQPEPRRSLIGKTALIIGLGNVGREVAYRCKQAGMHVLGIRNTPVPTKNVDEVAGMDDLMALLPRADYVCLHTPLTDLTRDLLGAAQFAAMPPGSYFLNAARGGIVDEAALHQALISGHLCAAYSDVFAQEPLPADSPLWDLDNLIISPHYADSIDNWKQYYVDLFADNLQCWIEGKPLRNIVDPQKGY